MRLHPLTLKIANVAYLFMIAGLLLGNRVYLWALLFLISLLALGSLVKPPHAVRVTRSLPARIWSVGNNCRVEVSLEVKKGMGPIIIADLLPQAFRLAEGNNMQLFWKGLRTLSASYSYQVCPAKPGKHNFDGVIWRSWDALGLFAGQVITEEVLAEMEVIPRLARIKKKRNVAPYSPLPFPSGARTAHGISTLEFKELRFYQHGDPLKNINWKATARSLQSGSMPVVNEFEREGKKAVWIFLDHSKAMYMGTNIRNSWDCAIQAINSLASYYLRENINVGFSTYGKSNHFIYPGMGWQHYWRILRLLVSIESGVESGEESSGSNDESNGESPAGQVDQVEKWYNLKQVAMRHRAYFMGQQPFSIVITCVTPESSAIIREGARQLANQVWLKGTKYPVVVINISGYNLLARTENDRAAARLLQIRDWSHLAKLKKKVYWVDWSPAAMDFSLALNRLEVR